MSCNEDVTRQIGTDMKGVLGVAAFESGAQLDVVSTYEVGKRQAKSFSLKAYAEEVCGVALKVTFGTDASYVDVYNEANGTNYQMLPGDAFAFGESDVLMPRFNVYSAESKLTLIGQGCEEDVFYLLPVTITKVVGSENYEISETTGVIYFLMKVLPASKGTGTKDDPFLITELEDFVTMSEKLIPADKVYFDLQTDLDLADVTSWASLNSAGDCTVYFNGNNHTISNYKGTSGIFHILNGSIENLILEDCSAETSGNGRAVLANFLGYSNGVNGHIKNVVLKNCDINSTSGQSVGVLVGAMYNSLIENVYMENCDMVSAGRRAGIVVGKIINDATVAEIKNCYVKGGSATGQQQIGGIIGEVEKTSSKVSFCGCSADMVASRAQASIVAYYNGTAGKSNSVENCVVWSSKVDALDSFPGTSDKYSSGVVIGCALEAQGPYTFKNCFYRPDIVFEDYSEINVLSSMSNVENGVVAGSHSYNYPWHGTAAEAGQTASSVAKTLGWDETIWDLSGDEPKLK